MNAVAPIVADLARFTDEQAEALIIAAEQETELRLKLHQGPMEGSIRTAIKRYPAGVIDLARDVLDGIDEAHAELQAELEAVDVHRLWTATADPMAFLPDEGAASSHMRSTAGMVS